MKTFRQQFVVLPLLLGMLSAVLVLAVLPIPGSRAIGQVTHPNDIFTEVYRAASPAVVGVSVAVVGIFLCHRMAEELRVCAQARLFLPKVKRYS